MTLEILLLIAFVLVVVTAFWGALSYSDRKARREWHRRFGHMFVGKDK